MRNRRIIIRLVFIIVVLNLGFLGFFYFSNHLSFSDSISYEWLSTWGGVYGVDYYSAEGKGVVIDSSNNIYVAGNIYRPPEAGDLDLFLVKYDSSGKQQWNRTWGAKYYDYFENILLDSEGGVYIAGWTINRYGGEIFESFLLKLDPMGVLLWNRTWSSINSIGYNAITLDSNGNIYFAGTKIEIVEETDDSPDFLSDIQLVKFNRFGVQQWNYTWNGSNLDYCEEIVLDSQGNIYVTGLQAEEYGDNNIFLVKFDNTGDLKWNRTWDGSDWDYVNTIALDSEGNTYLAGFKTNYSIDLSGLNYSYDIFLVKYNNEGVQLWNNTWDGGKWDYCSKLAIDSQGNIFLVGSSRSTGKGQDLLLIKYNNIGELLWNNAWGELQSDTGHDIALDSADNVYITGANTNKMFLMKISNMYVISIPGYELILFLSITCVISITYVVMYNKKIIIN